MFANELKHEFLTNNEEKKRFKKELQLKIIK